MSSAEMVALVVVTAWLAVVSFVLLLLVRQLGLLTVKVDQGGGPVAMSQDGLDVGEPVPEDVASALSLNGTSTYVLLLTTTCGPCRELAADLKGTSVEVPVTALISGADDLADALVDMLPDNVRIVRDPDATSLARSLRINSSPFAMELTSDMVTGKSYVNSSADLRRLIEAGRNEKELVGNGHS